MLRAGTRQAFARAAQAIRQAQDAVGEIKLAGDRTDRRRGHRAGAAGRGRTSLFPRPPVSATAAQETVDGRSRPA
jgi:hypothetical protein